MNRKLSYLVTLSTVFIVGAWVGGWYLSLMPEFREVSNQPVADTFSSLNALFAGFAFLGVIFTVLLQMEELQDTRKELARTSEANQKMAADSNLKAVFDLYSAYSTDRFQEVRNASMRVFHAMAIDESYRNFVVSRSFVTNQIPAIVEPQERLWRCFCKDPATFMEKERADRLMLDELINFFSLLALRADLSEHILKCEFFYSWMRPYFVMYSMLQQAAYDVDVLKKQYDRPPLLPSVVTQLDRIYGFKPINTVEDMWRYFWQHPKIAPLRH